MRSSFSNIWIFRIPWTYDRIQEYILSVNLEKNIGRGFSILEEAQNIRTP